MTITMLTYNDVYNINVIKPYTNLSHSCFFLSNRTSSNVLSFEPYCFIYSDEPFQSGFKSGHITETTFVNINSLTCASDWGQIFILILFYFLATFSFFKGFTLLFGFQILLSNGSNPTYLLVSQPNLICLLFRQC